MDDILLADMPVESWRDYDIRKTIPVIPDIPEEVKEYEYVAGNSNA